MSASDKFNAETIAQIAKEIEVKIAAIARLRDAADRARDDLNSAETDLHNLQSGLTREVLSQLDHSLIPQRIFVEADAQ